MRVQELIDKLQKLDPEALVFLMNEEKKTLTLVLDNVLSIETVEYPLSDGRSDTHIAVFDLEDKLYELQEDENIKQDDKELNDIMVVLELALEGPKISGVVLFPFLD
jgi:hypothetical protein